VKQYLFVLLLVGCVHKNIQPSNSLENVEEGTIGIEQDRLEKLEWQIDYLNYEQVNLQCFNILDHCYFTVFDKCSEGSRENRAQCLKQGRALCFSRHEKCVIDNYQRWKAVNKAKGRKMFERNSNAKKDY
jgi:hypothetical protein